MAISAALVKELRERTGLGMMECKKALAAVDGDVEKAIEELRKSGQAKAARKAGRTAAEGMLAVKVSDDHRYAVMIEVNSETDFVARDKNFIDFTRQALEMAFDSRGISMEQLVKDMENARQALVQKIGENVSIRRFTAVEGDVVNAYVHGNQRIAVLVALGGGTGELAKDVAMHVAAVNPEVISPDDMPADVLEKETEIFRAQALESGKPVQIVEKMVTGRIKKFLAENSLTEQAFIKNPDITVGSLVKDSSAKIAEFIRYEVGEGIEKEVVDFAAEVRAQVSSTS